MKKNLFFETFDPSNSKIIIVEKNDGDSTVKEYYTEGPTVLVNEKNQNGRIYDGEDIERALNIYNKKFIEGKRALGELDHPIDPDKSVYVELQKASHLFIEYRRDGNYIISKAKVLSTSMGNIAKALLQDGVKLGISTRGIGDIIEEKGIPKVLNYEFVTMGDYVHDPSAPGAFLDLIKEGRILIDFNSDDIKKIKKEERSFHKKYKINLSSSEKSKALQEFFINIKKRLSN